MRARNAFTLTELVVVIVLLGIIAIVGFVVIGSFQTQDVYAAAERTAADLRYARSLALTSALWHGVSFEAAGNTYRLYQTDGSSDTAIKDPSDPGRDHIIDLSAQYDGVVITSVNIGGGNQVEFDPYGRPFTDTAGVTLSATATIVLNKDSDSADIYIAPETGRIYVQ